ncbi:hypothetical protein ACB092_11G194200 [Castanea dentata]
MENFSNLEASKPQSLQMIGNQDRKRREMILWYNLCCHYIQGYHWLIQICQICTAGLVYKDFKCTIQQMFCVACSDSYFKFKNVNAVSKTVELCCFVQFVSLR